MSKERIKRLENVSQPRGNELVMVYQDPDRDYMAIKSIGFEGTNEEGNAIMKNYPRSTMFVIHHIPDSWMM